jgi:hypothetical protein
MELPGPPAWSPARRSESVAGSRVAPQENVTSPKASFEARDISQPHPLTTVPSIGHSRRAGDRLSDSSRRVTHRPPRRGDVPGVKSVRPERIDHTHGDSFAARYVAPVRLECIREMNLRLQNLPPSFSFGQTSGPGRPGGPFAARLPRERAARRPAIPVAQGESRKRPGTTRRSRGSTVESVDELRRR